MNASRVAAWIFVVAVLGAWLASAAGVSRVSHGSRVAESAAAPNPVDHLASDVQAQAGRLRERLDTAPAPQTPLRNPFAFAPRAHVVLSRPLAAAAVLPPAPIEPPEPLLELVGIAEKKVGEGVVRTAMMADQSGDVIMATAGQRVLGIYEVVAVSLDAVELKHVTTGAILRRILR